MEETQLQVLQYTQTRIGNREDEERMPKGRNCSLRPSNVMRRENLSGLKSPITWGVVRKRCQPIMSPFAIYPVQNLISAAMSAGAKNPIIAPRPKAAGLLTS